MLKLILKCFVAFHFIMFISGCGLDEKIIEDIAFIQTKGYDLIPEEDIKEGEEGPVYKFTTAAPLVDPYRTKERISRTTTTRLNKEGIQRLAKTTERYMVSGQLRLLLYSQDVAKQGLGPLLDVLERDPQIPARTKLAIVEGKAERLINKEFDEHPRTTVYLNELLDKEARFNVVPETKLYQFFRDLKDDSRDPVLPILKLGEDSVMIRGLGFFENDTLKAKIDFEDSLIFFFLEKNFRQGDLNMSIPNRETDGNELVSYTSISTERDFDVKKTGSTFDVTIFIQIKGTVWENIGDIDISDEEGQEKLESLIEQYIKEKAEEIIAFTQKHQVDPIGVGIQIRNSLSYDEWNALDWREEWPNVQVHCEVDIDIRDFGMVTGN